MHILLVEDDPALADSTGVGLADAGLGATACDRVPICVACGRD
jgi:DNA-binding response OmpR family regulator